MKLHKRITGTALAVCGLLLPLLSGCALMSTNYIEPREYDLSVPAEPLTDVRFELTTFRNLSGSDRRFLYREKAERMLSDDYSRWLLTPDLMLERQLQKALFPRETRSNGNGLLLRLGGTIYRFEFDRERKMAVLTVDYTVRIFVNRRPAGSGSLCVTTEKPIEGDTPASAAAAMSGCVEDSFAAVRKLLTETNAEAQKTK